ncbi:MAG TPA: hypothetical protein PLO44_00590 [Candidatus Paceibacterota bacterium]|nr:hypothetical protein [Candidatus Paceibacterota bacterium]
MKSIIKNFFAVTLAAFVLFAPILSFAQQTGDLSGGSQTGDLSPSTTTINNPIGVSDVNSFIRVILVGVVKIGIPIVALAIIYSGFLFVTARGNPEALKKAKSAFLYTVIGAAILLGSWAIAQLISSTVLEIGKSV